MRIRVQLLIATLLFALTLGLSWAQEGPRQTEISSTVQQGANDNYGRRSDRTLSTDERLSVIAAALDSKTRQFSQRDCSHLVSCDLRTSGLHLCLR